MGKIESLVLKAQAGDDAAFEKLIDLKRNEIVYMALRFSKNATDAEDYAQEAVVHAYGSIRDLKSTSSFNSWLYGVVRNTCHYGERKQQTYQKTIPLADPQADEATRIIEEKREEFLPAQYLESQEKRSLVLNLIDSLKDNYKDCLFLYYFEGLSYDEMAQVLGVGRKKVANDLVRAKQALKKMIEDKTGDNLVFSSVPLGALPVLTQVYQSDFVRSVNPEASNRLLEFTHVMIQGSTPLIAASGAVAAAGQAATTAGMTSGAKLALGALSVAVVACCGGGAYMVTHDGQLFSSNTPSAIEAPLQEETVVSEADSLEAPAEVAQEEIPIATVSEMIGADNEKALLAFEQQPPDAGLWQDFLASIGAHRELYASLQDGHVCLVYLLEKHDKQLLIAEYQDARGNPEQIVHLFREKGPIPDIMDFILMFDT